MHLLDLDEMGHSRNHPTYFRAVITNSGGSDPAKPKSPQGLPLIARPTDFGANLGDLQTSHHTPTPAARARSIAGGATSSIGRPRRAAISSGRMRPRSAETVACTMLMGFDEPSDFDRTS